MARRINFIHRAVKIPPWDDQNLFSTHLRYRGQRERSIINKSIVGTRGGISYVRASVTFFRILANETIGEKWYGDSEEKSQPAARAAPLVNFAPFNSIWKVSRGNSIEISFIRLSKSGTSYRACWGRLHSYRAMQRNMNLQEFTI